ncbi:MAG: flippase-like domain-containing protein, partial [Sinomicrobium sp.]|nr:flippase-like domain-containing protein [Sinomicrobium sp.]
MRSQIVKWLKLLLPLLLAFVLMWWVYSKFTPQQLQTIRLHFKQADYRYVLLSVVFGFLSHISRAWRWNYMLYPLGYTPRFYNNVMAIGVSYILNLLIPRSGELSRAAIMQKYEHIPFEKGFGTIVAERAVDLIILFFLALLAFFIQYETLKTFVLTHINLYGVVIMLAVVALGFLGLIIYIKRSSSPLSVKIKIFITGLKTGIFSILKMKKKGLFMA